MNGTNTTCVFWDPTLDGGNGAFSTEGGSLLREDDESAVCQFDHLTSFAILLVNHELEYYTSITIVQSYTGKYHSFVAICIVTSVQHE